MKKLTVVIPVRNKHATLRENITAISKTLTGDGIDADILIVDDGSDDSTWFELRELSERSDNIFGIRLSRSFGRDAAVFAGLEQADTPLCLIMNSDLSHPPHIVRELIGVMERSGADVVEGIEDGTGKKGGAYGFFSGMLRGIIKAASGADPWAASDFRLMSRKAVLALRRFGESEPSFRGIMDWSGFSVFKYPYAAAEPEDGEGKDTRDPPLGTLAKGAAGAVLSRAGKPPGLMFFLAILCLLGALACGIHAIAAASGGNAYGLSCVISVILTVGCFILVSLGVIGANISRMRAELRRRPNHIISDKTGGVFNKP